MKSDCAMRKKLDTRFPAARIKKIMQADEDVGKIAMAVPVLVSKALELFLQDLCDRTYDITVQRGAKTVSSLHLKHCVHSYNVFDFLREVVNKVPDYGSSDAAADTSKRRKVAANELNESDEESKRHSMQQEATHASSTGRGRGRGRGRGHGRASRATARETSRHEIESSSTISQQSIGQISSPGRAMDSNSNWSEPSKEDVKVVESGSDSRNFDLNAGVDEGSDKMASTATAVATGPSDAKGEQYPGLSEVDTMAIDPVHLAQFGSRLDEEEEDYDIEG